MIDHAQRRALTLVVGRSGTGKTEAALRYLVNAPAVARFVFDPDGQRSERLNIPAASGPDDLEADLSSGWVVFHPSVMFPGRHAEALRFFLAWIWSVSERGPGRKIVLIDEVWKYCTPTQIPHELAECVQDGRTRGIELILCTQTPNKVHASIMNEVTELIAFRLGDDTVAAALKQYGVQISDVLGMPRFHWLAWNVDDGGPPVRGVCASD